ncbi:hypothetical protein [Salinispira pacifica]|uniref:hypothetical protein n=1 Tax=Salinispira pacifica TaxID=1307761 RepID=UPI0009DE100E|nr:hypothetical protein [Salinispira pacifica]
MEVQVLFWALKKEIRLIESDLFFYVPRIGGLEAQPPARALRAQKAMDGFLGGGDGLELSDPDGSEMEGQVLFWATKMAFDLFDRMPFFVSE